MKSVDWSKWSAIAEILSALAIVITILYLAIETNQNTQAIRAASAQAALESETRVVEAWYEFPELLLFASCEGRAMDDEDVVRFHTYFSLWVRAHENLWRQYRLGVLDQESLRAYQFPIIRFLALERPRAWWDSMNAAYQSGFVQQINSQLDALGPSENCVVEGLKQALGVAPEQ